MIAGVELDQNIGVGVACSRETNHIHETDDTVRRLVDEHGVDADNGHRLWSLLVLAEWRSQRAA